jgi:hypothetical protein
MLSAETFEVKKNLLTVSLAKPRYKRRTSFENNVLFIYADVFCNSVQVPTSYIVHCVVFIKAALLMLPTEIVAVFC